MLLKACQDDWPPSLGCIKCGLALPQLKMRWQWHSFWKILWTVTRQLPLPPHCGSLFNTTFTLWWRKGFRDCSPPKKFLSRDMQLDKDSSLPVEWKWETIHHKSWWLVDRRRCAGRNYLMAVLTILAWNLQHWCFLFSRTMSYLFRSKYT